MGWFGRRSARGWARGAAVGVAAALGVVGGVPSAQAAATITRYSGNHCATARFDYTYSPDGSGSYHIAFRGRLTWDTSRATCGPFRDPYAGMLQWSGYYNLEYFGWEAAPSGSMYSSNPHTINWSGDGFRDVRFRVCNWNVRTGYVGTCGSW
ncbi:hypothetical protein [Bailinhaonella thermotolerans]|uniref:hypothetical protein n=1 Tax=Bailinhaonella thermotolerans TaxID=1070861 RepID=UPI00192A45F6|nr:hypothetical protein [Bailinhaonella thermotolerans]